MRTRESAARFVFFIALFLGLTFLSGGLMPRDRAGAMGLFALAALLSLAARPKEPLLIPWPLLLPVAGVLVAFAAAPIPALSFDATALFIFLILATATLARFFESTAPCALLAAALFVSLSIMKDAAVHFSIQGRSGLGLSSSGYLLGGNISSTALAAMLPAVIHLAARKKLRLLHVYLLLGLSFFFTVTPLAMGLPLSHILFSRYPLFLGFFVLFLLAVLHFEKTDPRLARLTAAAVAAFFIIAAILLTGSRTGLIALFFGLILPFRELPPRMKRLALLGAAVIIAAAALIYLPRFLDKLSPGYITNVQRYSMIGAVMKGLQDAPLLGHGAWSFPVIGQRFLSFPKFELHPHSFPLRVLFESGLAGLTLWILFIFIALRKRGLSPFSAAVALGLLGGALTDDPFWIPVMSALFLLALASNLRTSAKTAALSLPLPLAALLILLLAIPAAVLPFLHGDFRRLPLAPPSFELDRIVASGKGLPSYKGWEEDPVALRIAGWEWWRRGDAERARAHFTNAFTRDPLMLFAPHPLDVAWTLAAEGRETEAGVHIERVRRAAPVLAAWYSGETSSSSWSLLDRHYKIEFPDPRAVRLDQLRPVGDPLDWREHRYRMARAIMEGRKKDVVRSFQRSEYLAWQVYGTDPVLYRLFAENAPDETDTAFWATRAERRRGPAPPAAVYLPLIYRHPLNTTGDNSPWGKVSRKGDSAPWKR